MRIILYIFLIIGKVWSIIPRTMASFCCFASCAPAYWILKWNHKWKLWLWRHHLRFQCQIKKVILVTTVFYQHEDQRSHRLKKKPFIAPQQIKKTPKDVQYVSRREYVSIIKAKPHSGQVKVRIARKPKGTRIKVSQTERRRSTLGGVTEKWKSGDIIQLITSSVRHVEVMSWMAACYRSFHPPKNLHNKCGSIKDNGDTSSSFLSEKRTTPALTATVSKS